jgi:hypothetical protein
MSKEPYPSETADRFIVRFPDGMRDRIAESAKANNRSMNSEIVARIAASFEADNANAELIELMKTLSKKQDSLDERISRLEK